MTAQQLKNSILQMAVQGKLVPQDPNDEPASVLLERIRAEKEQLIKEKKIKKEKNPSVIFRGADNLPYEKVGKNEPVCIADEVPFEIPDSWEWVRIKNLGAIIRGSGIKRNETVESGFPCVRYGEIYTTYNTSFTSTVSFIPEEINEKCKHFSYGDILMTLTGENKPDIAKAVAYLGEEPVAAGGDLAFWTAHGMNPLYLAYLLASPYVISRKVELATGDIIVHISGDKIGSILIPIPPLNEQMRIVEKIQETEGQIRQYSEKEQELTTLHRVFPEALKKSILLQAVQGKLVEQDPTDELAEVLLERIRAEKQRLVKEGKIKKDKHESIIFRRDNSHYEKRGNNVTCIDSEIPFTVPNTWAWSRFEYATIYTTDYVANGSFSSLKENVKTYKEPNYALMVKTQDFANNFSNGLTYTDREGYLFLHKSKLHGGELMLSNIGASIGKAFIIPPIDMPMTLAPNSIVVKCYDEITTQFIRYVILSFYGQELLNGFTAGTAMPKFSKTQLRSALLPIPPYNEQKRIVEKINELMLKLDTL